MLSTQDIAHVRRGWAAAGVEPERTADAFYTYLFRVEPAARSLFREDMTVQGRKLTRTFDAIVDALDRPESLMPMAKELARRHVAYGVRPEHYDDVGAALLFTLSEVLGGALSEEEKVAWSRVYGTFADAMKAAAYPEGGPPGGTGVDRMAASGKPRYGPVGQRTSDAPHAHPDRREDRSGLSADASEVAPLYGDGTGPSDRGASR